MRGGQWQCLGPVISTGGHWPSFHDFEAQLFLPQEKDPLGPSLLFPSSCPSLPHSFRRLRLAEGRGRGMRRAKLACLHFQGQDRAWSTEVAPELSSHIGLPCQPHVHPHIPRLLLRHQYTPPGLQSPTPPSIPSKPDQLLGIKPGTSSHGVPNPFLSSWKKQDHVDAMFYLF